MVPVLGIDSDHYGIVNKLMIAVYRFYRRPSLLNFFMTLLILVNMPPVSTASLIPSPLHLVPVLVVHTAVDVMPRPSLIPRPYGSDIVLNNLLL